MHRADEVECASGRALSRRTRPLRLIVRGANYVEALTGPHAVATQLGEQLGCVLGNGEAPAVGGAQDQQDTGRSPLLRGDLRLDANGESPSRARFAKESSDVELAGTPVGRIEKLVFPLEARPGTGMPWRTRSDTRAAGAERMGAGAVSRPTSSPHTVRKTVNHDRSWSTAYAQLSGHIRPLSTSSDDPGFVPLTSDRTWTWWPDPTPRRPDLGAVARSPALAAGEDEACDLGGPGVEEGSGHLA